MSTIGIDEETIWEYIRRQEEKEHRLDQLELFRTKTVGEAEYEDESTK